MTLTNRFGIYLHVPFCVHKCSYCDFYSFTRYTPADFTPFVEALVRETKSAAAWLQAHRPLKTAVTSIFLGGGTPSLLPPPQLQTLFDTLAEQFEWSSQIEITLEANPETITEDLVQKWRELTPINRVSMGAQSFQSRYLKTLERLGSAERIREASEVLRASGFTNFNLDLIIGIPEQSVEEIRSDIQQAVALGPTHISNYNLTLKPGHPLFHQLPNSDISADLYEAAREALSQNGFDQYEISNYARPGFECAHNQLYWSGGDYLGLGPSAASRFFWDGVFHHRKQITEQSQYLQQESFEVRPFEGTTLSETQLEALFLELRRNEGIQLESFQEKYRIDLMRSPRLALLEKNGFLEVKKPTLRLTAKGRLLADTIVCELIQ